MRHSIFLLLLSLAACGPVQSTLPLRALLVEASVEVRCDAGVGCEAESPWLAAPHCGHSLSAIAPDAGVVEVELGASANTLRGLWEVRTTSTDVSGGPVTHEPRRGAFTATRRDTLVYPAFGARGPLYELGLVTGLTPHPDAGEVLTDPSGAQVFAYVRSLSDGGTFDVIERHRLVATWDVQAVVTDRSGEPFYGCCAHVGGAAPALLLAVLGLLRRRQRGAPQG